MITRSRAAAWLGTLVLAAGGLVTALPASPVSAAPVTIQLLNINDFHGRIDANTTAWATLIEQQRALNPNTLLLGAGDLVGASVFASAVADDQPTIDVMNAMGLNGSAVGNHEFDKGWPDLRDRVIGPDGARNATWDYLAANISDAGGLILDPYAIYDVGGISVGVIGAVTEETPTIVSPAGIEGLTFSDPVEAVNTYAAQLSDGDLSNGEADVIVAEYHEGGPTTAPTGEVPTPSSPIFDRIVNETSADVDAIFTGHTHKAYAFLAADPDGNDRPVVETGEYGANVGRVTLTLDDVTGDIDYAETTATYLPRMNVVPDPVTYPRVAAVQTIVNDAIADAAVIGSQPKGSVTGDITRAYSDGTYTGTPPVYGGGVTTDRTNESTLGGLVADALLDTLAPEELGGAQIGVVNPGGLRDDLLFAPDGTITYAEANAVLPFVNNLWTTSLTGAQFKALLEQQWRPGAYLQLGLSANVTYTFDSTLPEGARITSISVDGKPIDPLASYRIGTFNFLATGGDAFTVFTQGTDTRDSGLVDRDGWIKYIEDNSPLSPDFARQSTEVSPLPTTAVPGESLQFTVSKLDLTSLGSPKNTELHVAIGGLDIGTVPVTDGSASVDLEVPSNVPSGAQTMTLLADPTNTLVSIPVSVPASIVPLSPARILDSRIGGQTVDDQFEGIGIRTAGSILELDVAGRGGVPADATGVVLNLTATDATGTGFVTVWPCGQPRPVASSSNFAVGAASPNAVVSGIGTDGKVCLYTAEANVHLIADVNGLVPDDGGYTPVNPARLLETRLGASTIDSLNVGEGQRAAGSTYTLQVAGRGGVPSDAAAVALNVTATNSTGTGYVTVWPCTEPRPVASSVNFVQGDVAPNSVLTQLDDAGQICLYVAENAADVVVDVFGYFPQDAAFGGITPARLLETRAGAPTVDGEGAGGGLVAPNTPVEVQVAGRAGVPEGANGAVLNVTATDATGTGYVTVWPCGEDQPYASTANYIANTPSPNAAIMKLGEDGTVCLVTAEASAQLIVDVTAYL